MTLGATSQPVETSQPASASQDRSWIAALGVLALATVICVVVLNLPAHLAADVTHYKYWAKQVATHGVSGAYTGTYPETAAIYPPVTMYGYRVAGWIYRRFYDPEFEIPAMLESHALTVLVKLVAVIPHLVASAAIFWLLRRRYGPGPALAATAAFALNPAAIFDAAYWGQPDVVHALFLLIAIYCFEEDRPEIGYAFIGLAAATKPQAWALLPFLGYVSLARFGLVRTLLGGVVAGLAAALACLPYIWYGTFWELLKLPELIAVTMPVASANAHNLWWIVTGGKPDFVLDAAPVLGPVTYRQAAAVLSLLVMAYGLWRTNVHGRDGQLSEMAAYLAFGWFLVTTRAHENHAFFALPLLVMATPRSRFAWAAFGIITLTQFANMTLHDFSLEPFRASLLPPSAWLMLQLADATVNIALFLVWSVRLWSCQRVTGVRVPADA